MDTWFYNSKIFDWISFRKCRSIKWIRWIKVQEYCAYMFELDKDVTIKVAVKEKIENSKTGVIDIITILIIGFMISISGFFIVKRYNERYEI